MSHQPTVKREVPPKSQSKQGKKEKGPPKLQPAWLFPPDKDNPVLNPKEKSHNDVEKSIEERKKAVDYMQRRVHGVPDRPAPDPLLLTLIGIFLTDFGFNSTSRLFTNERQARQTLNGWEDALGKKIDKATPKLEQIFRDWHRDWLVKRGNETSSSDSSEASSDDESEVAGQTAKDGPKTVKEGCNVSSASSDVEMGDGPQSKNGKKAVKKIVPSSSPSLSSSSSESDADVEKEIADLTAEPLPKKIPRLATAQPTGGGTVRKLKRKAQSSLAKSTSDSSEDEKPTKVKKLKIDNAGSGPAKSTKGSQTAKMNDKSVISLPKTTTKSSKATKAKNNGDVSASVASVNISKAIKSKTKKVNAASLSTSEASSTSSSESGEGNSSKPKQSATSTGFATTVSDPSATINGDSKKPSANASSSFDSSSATSSSSSSAESSGDDAAVAAAAGPKMTKTNPAVTTTSVKAQHRPHKGAKATPLAELSMQADADEHPSNKYQSYDYAERAYKDLSVTRGKGFTKEKNKKKRGSYRGGPIDTSGGKGFRFEE